MSGVNWRRRYGPAGLLVTLFVVGGLIFSYGMGHGPLERICTQDAMSAPVAAASGVPAATAPDAGAAPLHGLHSAAIDAWSAPAKRLPPETPVDACLCLGVLFTLVLLGLAVALGRRSSRMPARVGWVAAPLAAAASALALRPCFQVLRL